MILKKDSTQKVAIIGDGSWGTALTKIFSDSGNKVKWWVRGKEDMRYIRKMGKNPKYLSSVKFVKRRVKPFSNIKRVIKDVEIVVLAVPAAFISEVLDNLRSTDLQGKIIVTSIKGMIPEKHLLVSEYVAQKFHVNEDDIAVISGPCHAEEIAMEKQSFLTIACKNPENNDMLAERMSGCFYVKTTKLKDVEGIEYAAAMKNIVALACGMSHGLNLGDNFQAVLVSNAMQEIKKFLDVTCPGDRDLQKSVYLGDLLVTAYSQFSRNRSFGLMIGRGYSVKSAMMEMKMIAEGYYAVKSIYAISQKHNLEMPICDAVYRILYEKVTPVVEFKILQEKLT